MVSCAIRVRNWDFESDSLRMSPKICDSHPTFPNIVEDAPGIAGCVDDVLRG